LRTHALAFDHGLGIQAVVREAGVRLFVLGGQAHPDLQATEALRRQARLGRRTLGVHDAAPRRHPVHFARKNGFGIARAVAVHHRALVQIGDGRQANMRMRSDIQAISLRKLSGPGMIQKTPGTNHAFIPTRQGPFNDSSLPDFRTP